MLQTDMRDRSGIIVSTSPPDLEEFDKQQERLLKTLTGYSTNLHETQLNHLRSAVVSSIPSDIHTLFSVINSKISVVDAVSSAHERDFIHSTLERYGYKTGRKNRDIRPK